MSSWSVTIQMKATEQYFPVALFIMNAVQGGPKFWVCEWNANLPPLNDIHWGAI